jgi:hypothetical protein
VLFGQALPIRSSCRLGRSLAVDQPLVRLDLVDGRRDLVVVDQVDEAVGVDVGWVIRQATRVTLLS